MKKKEYYENKILYALSKIDYAQSKMANKEHKNKLATLYFVLQNYKKIDLKTIMNVTKLNKDDVVFALNVLKQLGLTRWTGEYLTKNKTIYVTEDAKPKFTDYIQELNKKYYKKYGEPLLKGKEMVLDDEVILGKEQPQEDEWIEIQYSKDVIMKVKKSSLKKLL